MNLEFLINLDIKSAEKIPIPFRANYFSLQSGKIKLFNVNSSPTRKMKKIPNNAKYISFNMEKYAYHIDYGDSKFYDKYGNLLKIGENV